MRLFTFSARRRLRLGLLAGLGGLLGLLAAPARPQATHTLPASVQAALERARLPASALSVRVQQAQGSGRVLLDAQSGQAQNPASLMKLVTTAAALDQLGPAWQWRTPVLIDGALRDGVLHGSLYIQGRGDPKLVQERLWLLLRRVQGLGITHIEGDIVLDHSAFAETEHNPSDFDGEPLRPYNAAPDALLINYRSLLITLTPLPAQGLARVAVEPALAGVQMPASVPLANTECGDYRSALRADFSSAQQIRLQGSYPLACGEKVWPIAYVEPASFARRAVQAQWLALGGSLGGQVRDGLTPAQATRVFDFLSPPLAEVVRDINKFSNNVMAQQLFLSLSLEQDGRASAAASRQWLQQWWQDRLGGAPAPSIDNGSGLSRQSRISAAALAQLLRWAYERPFMPELMASLPQSAVDGTLRNSRARASAHLKTGSLRDVAGVAGYVDAAQGQRWVLVAIVNHPQAGAARPVFDALVDWASRQP